MDLIKFFGWFHFWENTLTHTSRLLLHLLVLSMTFCTSRSSNKNFQLYLDFYFHFSSELLLTCWRLLYVSKMVFDHVDIDFCLIFSVTYNVSNLSLRTKYFYLYFGNNGCNKWTFNLLIGVGCKRSNYVCVIKENKHPFKRNGWMVYSKYKYQLTKWKPFQTVLHLYNTHH